MMKSAKIPVMAVIAFTAILSVSPLRGQSSHVSLSLGAAIPELLNAGVTFNTGRAIFGATVGTFPIEDEATIAAGINGGLHFAGKSEYTDLPPWYALAGFHTIRNKTLDEIERYTYLSLRAGREINFSSRAALGIEAGILFETGFAQKGIGSDEVWNPGNSWFPVLPVIGTKFIWRLIPKEIGGANQ